MTDEGVKNILEMTSEFDNLTSELVVKLSKSVIKKSNAIARSTWAVTSLWHQRILAAVLSQILPSDEEFHVYTIPLSEFAHASGRTLDGTFYDEIQNAIRKIFSAPIVIRQDNDKTITVNAFSSCVLDRAKGIIEAKFDNVLKPHYLKLQQKFTIYPMLDYMGLRSIYSQKLYEILMSWRYKNTVVLSLANLFSELSVPQSFTKNFKDFRINVLEACEKDINSKTKLIYRWEPIKKNRKVIAIKFIFYETLEQLEQEKQKLQLDEHTELSKLSNACYLKHVSKGTTCTPNSGKKCKFCLERGRMKAKNILNQLKEQTTKKQ